MPTLEKTSVEAVNESDPMIADSVLLFRYSGMLDALRDSTKLLYRGGTPSTSTVEMCIKQYGDLRDALKSTVRPDIATEIENRTPTLSSTTGFGIDSVYVAAVQLAQLIDVVHQTPDWLLSQQVRQANAVQVKQQIEAQAPREPQPSVLHFGMKY